MIEPATPPATRLAPPHLANDRVRIFDTTLRDGEQAPGFSMGPDAKLRVAEALAALKVDVIEAGFASAGPGEVAAIRRIAERIQGPAICSLARASDGDIRAAGDAIAAAKRSRIHVFIATSPLHREAKLKMSKDQILERIDVSVRLAREFTDDVEFSAEDAIRTERDYLLAALRAANDAGATTLNVPDTVGYTTPEEIFDLFSFLSREIASDRAILSTHCHDDLGMAVANSLAAVRGGARQVECAINGIGERAGNCALEEVVMALKTRADLFGVTTDVDTTQLLKASRILSEVTNAPPPRNKAIVGINAFAHESGIHQHGFLANRETYEIMHPADIGLATDGIVLGKHSGRAAIVAKAATLGFDLSGANLDAVFEEFKLVSDRVGIIDAARLRSIIAKGGGLGGGLGEAGEATALWDLHGIEIMRAASDGGRPVARITLGHGDGQIVREAEADGALDAAFRAVSEAVGVAARVDELHMQYVAAPREIEEGGHQGANVLVEISIEVDGALYAGRARDRDILPACVGAYLDAVANAAAVLRQSPSTNPAAELRQGVGEQARVVGKGVAT